MLTVDKDELCRHEASEQRAAVAVRGVRLVLGTFVANPGDKGKSATDVVTPVERSHMSAGTPFSLLQRSAFKQ